MPATLGSCLGDSQRRTMKDAGHRVNRVLPPTAGGGGEDPSLLQHLSPDELHSQVGKLRHSEQVTCPRPTTSLEGTCSPCLASVSKRSQVQSGHVIKSGQLEPFVTTDAGIGSGMGM